MVDDAKPTEVEGGEKPDKHSARAEKRAQRKARREKLMEDENFRETWQHKFRLAVIWVIQYWRELFNFRFDKYMVIQVIPGVYGLALAGIAAFLGYLTVIAFMDSPWKGAFYLFFGAPLAFLVAASSLRALLEFYMVVFKIAEHVDELVGLRDTVDRLSGISDTVDEISTVTRRLPFWSTISGRRRVRRQAEKRAQREERGNRDDDNTESSTDGAREKKDA